MTIPQQTPIERQTANGTNDRFSFVFRILDDTDLYVYQNGILQQESVDYNLENVTELGGDVVFTVVPAAGTLVTIERDTPDTQTTNYEAGDPFPAESTETALDKLTMLVQEISSRAAQFILDKIGLAWDSLNYRITNLGDPQLPDDAVNQRSMENYVANNAPTGGQGPQGPTGDEGNIGPVGFIGPPGLSTEWFTVTAQPDPNLGIDGDYAINSVNGDFFAKLSGNWIFQGNLQGPIGGGGGTNDHSALINLGNNDHPQYGLVNAPTNITDDWTFEQTARLMVVTGPNNENPLIISRTGRADEEVLQVGLVDSIMQAVYRNDESFGTFQLVIVNSDTEAGAGVNSNSATINFVATSSDRSFDMKDGIRLIVRSRDNTGLASFGVDTTQLNTELTNIVDWLITGLAGRIKVGAEIVAYLSEVALKAHTHDGDTTNTIIARLTASNDTLLLTDAGKKICFAAAVPSTLIVPLHSAVPFADFSTILVRADNTQAVTITPDAGVTLRSFPNVLGARTISATGAHAILHYRPDVGLNTWDLDGRFL